MDRYGFELPLLLVGAFRSIIDELHEFLDNHGHGGSRPIHAFALQALGGNEISVTELGRRLGVTRQAAAKTVSRLRSLGYVEWTADPGDARATLVRGTKRGEDVLYLSAHFFEVKKVELAALLGEHRIDEFLGDLSLLARDARIGDLPGWLTRM